MNPADHPGITVDMFHCPKCRWEGPHSMSREGNCPRCGTPVNDGRGQASSGHNDYGHSIEQGYPESLAAEVIGLLS